MCECAKCDNIYIYIYITVAGSLGEKNKRNNNTIMFRGRESVTRSPRTHYTIYIIFIHACITAVYIIILLLLLLCIDINLCLSAARYNSVASCAYTFKRSDVRRRQLVKKLRKNDATHPSPRSRSLSVIGRIYYLHTLSSSAWCELRFKRV